MILSVATQQAGKFLMVLSMEGTRHCALENRAALSLFLSIRLVLLLCTHATTKCLE